LGEIYGQVGESDVIGIEIVRQYVDVDSLPGDDSSGIALGHQ